LGGLCYQELQNRNSPCEFCTNEIILKNRGESYQWEYYNSFVDRHLLLTDRIIKWPDGRDVRLEVAVDITERKQAEKALAESREHLLKEQERLQTITATLGDGLYVIDKKGRITFANPAAASMLGYTPEELMGRVSHDLFHYHFTGHERTSFEKCPFFQSILKGRAHNSEEIFQRKNGTLFPVKVTSRPMIDHGGVVGAVTVFNDISERKKAEIRLRESEEKHRSLMEHSLDMIYLHDLEGNFLEVNQAAVARTGYSREELLSMNVFDLHKDQSGRQEILRQWREWRPGQPTMLETVHMDKEGKGFPVEINTGKVCFSKKEYILALVRDISERKRTEQALKESRDRYHYLLQSSRKMKSFHNIIGRSRKMQRIYTLLQQVAGVDTTVLITGESGTGKELIVEALHAISHRSKGPLIKVNCLSLAEELLDSELFGHVRGAFTGAYYDKLGRVEAAQGGTLFLDEIGDLTPRIQLKLLRFLQEKTYERVGNSRPRNADVRIVAATNADLAVKVEKGVFRKDLYYRLKVIPVHLPPLRERREDIPLFISHFCKHFAETFDRPVKGVSTRAMRILLDYAWPGNVRELEHVLEHGTLLCPGGMIEPEHLPYELRSCDTEENFQKSGQKVDREGLIRALQTARGSRTEAARILGISRRTLYRKLHKHSLID